MKRFQARVIRANEVVAQLVERQFSKLKVRGIVTRLPLKLLKIK